MGSLVEFESQNGFLHSRLPGLLHVLEWAAVVVDVAAILVMLVGAVRFVIGFGLAEIARDNLARVRRINAERIELGRYILAGLELFIVSDIIHTALSLRLSDLIFLGLLVLIRSLISYFLGRELKEVREEMT